MDIRGYEFRHYHSRWSLIILSGVGILAIEDLEHRQNAQFIVNWLGRPASSYWLLVPALSPMVIAPVTWLAIGWTWLSIRRERLSGRGAELAVTPLTGGELLRLKLLPLSLSVGTAAGIAAVGHQIIRLLNEGASLTPIGEVLWATLCMFYGFSIGAVAPLMVCSIMVGLPRRRHFLLVVMLALLAMFGIKHGSRDAAAAATELLLGLSDDSLASSFIGLALAIGIMGAFGVFVARQLAPKARKLLGEDA